MADPIPFPFAPNWSDIITERLSWLTTVMASRSAAEQRYAVRLTPRRQIDIPLLISGQERSYFDVLLARNGGGVWNVPIPHEEFPVGTISAGDTIIYVDTAYRELQVGTKLLLRDTCFKVEVVEVTSVSDTNIGITAAVLTYNSAYAVPTFIGVLTEAVEATRHASRAYNVTMRFLSQEATVWPVAGRSLTAVPTLTVGGSNYPILSTEPNAINDLSYSFARNLSVFEDPAAIPIYTDKADRQLTSQKYEFFLTSPAQRQTFRDTLYALQGRLAPIWVPTFNDDLSLTRGYANPLGLPHTAIPGREYYVTFNRDGTLTSGTVAAYDGEPPENFDSSSVVRRSFVDLKRLDVDDIELQHYSGFDGPTTASVVFRDAPNLRVPASYTPRAFADAIFHYAGGDVTPTNDVAAGDASLAGIIATQTITG